MLGLGVLKAGGPAPHNVIVSNVPGPRKPPYHNRSRIDNFISVGPPVEAVGLNTTVWSYLDSMNYSVLAFRDLVPDLWRMVGLVQESFDELRRAADSGARKVVGEP